MYSRAGTKVSVTTVYNKTRNIFKSNTFRWL